MASCCYREWSFDVAVGDTAANLPTPKNLVVRGVHVQVGTTWYSKQHITSRIMSTFIEILVVEKRNLSTKVVSEMAGRSMSDRDLHVCSRDLGGQGQRILGWAP